MSVPSSIRLTALAVAVALAGCAGVSTRPDPPRLTIADLSLARASLFSQTYRIRFDVQNPNPFDLPIEGMAYELRINDQPFASGVSNQSVTVPRYGTGVLEVEAISTLAGLFRQISELERSRTQSFRYSLAGHMSLRGGPSRLPFDYKGEFSLIPKELTGSQ